MEYDNFVELLFLISWPSYVDKKKRDVLISGRLAYIGYPTAKNLFNGQERANTKMPMPYHSVAFIIASLYTTLIKSFLQEKWQL